MLKSNYKILSVGGSIVIPKTGFDIKFLKNFRKLILERIKMGDKFIFVVGGGFTARDYQSALRSVNSKITDKEMDWVGIFATWLNAEFVKNMFGNLAYNETIKDPSQKVKTNKPIIVAGGWKPGWSTDYDAVKLAEVYGGDLVVNMSNIDYVYDSDPKKFKNAKKIEKLNWKEMRKLVGDKWVPGKNIPFDPSATKLAQKLKLKAVFVKGTDLKQVKNVILGKEIKGTVVED